jgi:hypothetical protein
MIVARSVFNTLTGILLGTFMCAVSIGVFEVTRINILQLYFSWLLFAAVGAIIMWLLSTSLRVTGRSAAMLISIAMWSLAGAIMYVAIAMPEGGISIADMPHDPWLVMSFAITGTVASWGVDVPEQALSTRIAPADQLCRSLFFGTMHGWKNTTIS